MRLLLGAQFRRLREAAGVTPEQAGYEIRASRSKISRMEAGQVGLYGVTGERAVTRLRHRAAPAADYLAVADQLGGEALTPADTTGFIRPVAAET